MYFWNGNYIQAGLFRLGGMGEKVGQKHEAKLSGAHWLCSLAGQQASKISLSLPRAAGAAGTCCDADF